MPEVSVDETFERARERLHSFERVAPRDPPPSFVGTLREYQREGLGWLHFLRDYGLGGCLADDLVDQSVLRKGPGLAQRVVGSLELVRLCELHRSRRHARDRQRL